jgi:GR25 family glycosyltransferase involved in LPS biosynthesis
VATSAKQKAKSAAGQKNLTGDSALNGVVPSQWFSDEDRGTSLKEVEEVEVCPDGRMPVLIVNLNSRYDRWERTSVRFMGMSILDPSVCLEVGRYVATNGEKDPISDSLVTTQWKTERNRQYVGKGTWYDRVDNELKLTAGERGCAASHIRLWKQISKQKGPSVILEDDAVPVSGFAKKLKKAFQEVPKDADILYLGYSRPDKAPWRREIGNYIAEVDYVWTTVAYVIWPAGARKLLERLPVDSPVDNFMSWASHENKTKAYATISPIIKQEAPWGFASDVQHSDEMSQHATDTENLKKQVTLLTRPIREAQSMFMKEMNEAIFNLGDESAAQTSLKDAVAATAPQQHATLDLAKTVSSETPESKESMSSLIANANEAARKEQQSENPVKDIAKTVGMALLDTMIQAPKHPFGSSLIQTNATANSSSLKKK